MHVASDFVFWRHWPLYVGAIVYLTFAASMITRVLRSTLISGLAIIVGVSLLGEMSAPSIPASLAALVLDLAIGATTALLGWRLNGVLDRHLPYARSKIGGGAIVFAIVACGVGLVDVGSLEIWVPDRQMWNLSWIAVPGAGVSLASGLLALFLATRSRWLIGTGCLVVSIVSLGWGAVSVFRAFYG